MNNEQKNITEEIKQTDNESLSAVDLRVRRNFGKPTRPNATKKATAADTVYTKVIFLLMRG